MKRLDVRKTMALVVLVASAAPALAADTLTAKHDIAAEANQAKSVGGAIQSSGLPAGAVAPCACERRRVAQEAADPQAGAAREAVRRRTWASRNE